MIPLFQTAGSSRPASVRNIAAGSRILSWNAEDWWLGASPSSGDRRLAPRRLGSGRRGRADAEARRHRRVRAVPPEPACLNCFDARAARHRRPVCDRREFWRRHSRSAPTSRGGRGSSRVSTSRGSLHSRSRTTSAPKRDGATAYRSRRGTSSSRTRRSVEAGGPRRSTGLRSAARARSTRRRSGSYSDPDSPVGEGSSGTSCRGTRSRARTSTNVWSRPDRQPEDRRANRERPVPRRALGARQADHALAETLATGDLIRAYLERIVVRFRPRERRPVDWLRSGEFDVAHGSSLRASPGSPA